jgi:hypothetical protein
MKYIPIVLYLVFFLVPLLYGISVNFDIIHTRQPYTNWYDLIDSVTDVEVYGQVLFCAAILVAGLILLLVLIGVIYLTNNFNKIKATDQSILSKSHVILLK